MTKRTEGARPGLRVRARDFLRVLRLTCELTRVLAAAIGLRHRALPRRLAIARALRRVFERMGPAYGKLGQVIASSPGLFPEGFSEEFRSCLDRMPRIPFRSVVSIVTSELGKPMDELFESFESEPIASASIAQVHAARLLTGEDVVVKVQRPGIEPIFRRDLRVQARFAAKAESWFSLVRSSNAKAFVEDFAANIDHELDFEQEARSMERFGANLRVLGRNDGVRVPCVYWSHTSRRVLTMERVQGESFDEVAVRAQEGAELSDVLRRSSRAWMEAAFEHGFFHGDVHAGNLMLDTDGIVVFLDFGIMGTFSPEVLRLMREGMPAVVFENDARGLALAFYGYGEADPEVVERAADELAYRLKPMLDLPLEELSFADIFAEIIKVGARRGVRIPAEVTLVAKVLLYIDRYTRVLAPDWKILSDPEMIWFLLPGAIPAPAQHSVGDAEAPSANGSSANGASTNGSAGALDTHGTVLGGAVEAREQ